LEHGNCVYWYEEDRVAYLCSDGKTVRSIPGREHCFAEFRARFSQENPEMAKDLIFENPRAKPKKSRRRKKKKTTTIVKIAVIHAW
jgi:hypothetical protein